MSDINKKHSEIHSNYKDYIGLVVCLFGLFRHTNQNEITVTLKQKPSFSLKTCI